MARKQNEVEQFDELLDAHLRMLVDMPDEEVLDGEKPEDAQARGRQLAAEAKTAAQAARLRRARRLVADEGDDIGAEPVVDRATAAEARAFLERAANDGRYTMAARELREMSDEDALRLYRDLKELERGAGDTE